MKKKTITTILLINVLILFDQASKIIISSKFPLNNPVNIIPNFFSLTYSQNFGAAFGILEGKRVMFLIITVFSLIYIINEMIKFKGSIFTYTSFILLISGIVGNFIDRLFLGYVRDFIDFKIFNFNFAVFNLADSFMVIGAIMLFISVILEGKHEKNKK